MQAITGPDGLILHAAGSMEGRRHDWTLYIRSGLDERLAENLLASGKQYVLYGESGYNGRVFLLIQAQGSHLSDCKRALNLAMARSRVTVG